jgi:hypothetical protein
MAKRQKQPTDPVCPLRCGGEIPNEGSVDMSGLPQWVGLMQRVVMLAVVSALLAGCSTGGRSSRRPSSSGFGNAPERGPFYSINDTYDVDSRVKDLESHGASHASAVAKANREAERQAWTADTTDAANYERARRAYQQQQEELNQNLRKLLADRPTR